MKTCLAFFLSFLTGLTLSAQIADTVMISYVMNKTNPPSYTFSTGFTGEEARYHWYFGELTESREASPTYTFHYSGIHMVKVLITDKTGHNYFGRLEAKFEGRYPAFTSGVQTAKGKVTDLTGADGCGLVIVLDNGITLLPVEIIPEFELQAGQQVKVAYEILNRADTLCQAGKPARIHRIVAEPVEIGCKAFFTYYADSTASDKNTKALKFENNSQGELREWNWSFGDGTSSREKNPVHHFRTAGEYKVCLSILTTGGCRSEYCTSVKIEGPAEPVIYSGKGRVVDKTGLDGCGLVIVLEEGRVLLPLEIVPNFVLKPGQRIALAWEVLRDVFTICMAGIPVRIHKIAELPPDSCKAFFTATNQLWSDLSMMRRMVFSNQSSGNLRECLWTFGDGTSSREKRPVHEYAAYGRYEVCLHITTVSGCESSYCDTIEVAESVCPFEMVIKRKDPSRNEFQFFILTAAVIESVAWDFGDGARGDTLNPVHLYGKPGVYEVTCSMTTSGGCKATRKRKLEVEAPSLPPCPGAINLLLYDPYGPLTVCNGKAVVTLLDEKGEPFPGVVYSWSNGARGDTVAGLCPNTPYAVHAVVPAVCQKKSAFTFLTTPLWRVTVSGNKYSFCVVDPSDSIVYRWNFGDGHEAVGKSVDYQFGSDGSYQVTLTAISGNSTAGNSQEVTVTNSTTPAPARDLPEFSLYPNPAGQTLTLKLGSLVTEELRIEITDMKGGKAAIHHFCGRELRQAELPVGDLSEGIYLLRVTAGEKMLGAQKFMKKR